MNKKLLNILEELGLSQNEAMVYLTSLAIGASNISDIARTSGVKRTSVYPLIESLKQKGLVKTEVQGFKRLFAPENPEKLKVMLELQKQKLDNDLPNFMSLYNTDTDGAFIKYYEGLEGMRTVYDGILKELKINNDYMAISDTEKFQNLDKSYFDNFLKKRTALHVNTRLLLQDTKLAQDRKIFDRNFNEQIKILPKHTTLTTNLVIIPSKIIIHQLVPPILVTVIENKNIIKMHREIFEILWRSV